MGYFWDEECNLYYFHVKGSIKCIYNFNDPVEFVRTAETPVFDKQSIGGTLQDDTNMHDVDHGENEAWIYVATNQEPEEDHG